ncbi:MAG: helix-turn-helix transcriptional regulator [Labilithrix sp.]|nr:helix-turn-helix transcriptional regulator [Labilithrix sp.]
MDRAIADGRASSARDFSIRAGLAKGHVQAILNGELDPSLNTLDKVAAFGRVSLEHLVFGLEELPPRPLATEANDHQSPAFGPAARAFLELHSYSEDASDVVRVILAASFNEAHPWTPREWLEVLSEEHTTRSRAIRKRSA